MVMQMLEAGGLPIVTDGARAADLDNPRGYYELEAVKDLHRQPDPAWVRKARGKAVKVVSLLLTWLPESNNYRVIFVERDLDEVVRSQRKMLQARGEPAGEATAEETRALYAQHLVEVGRFLVRRPCFETLRLGYRDVIASPSDSARRLAAFIGRPEAAAAMAAAVDPTLYRNRRADSLSP